MRLRRFAVPLAGGLVALSCSTGVGPAFGGFVGTGQSTVTMAADSVDQHLTVSVPESGGRLELRNPTAADQEVTLRLIDPADGSASARFASTGADHATIPPGGSDTVDVLDSSSQPVGGKVALGIIRVGGTVFPSSAYVVPAP